MNEICGSGSRRLGLLRLSHLKKIYKNETTRFGCLSTRTTTTTRFGFRGFENTIVTMAGTQTKWTAPVVRKQFLDFFEGKGHTVGMWWGSCAKKESQDWVSQWTWDAQFLNAHSIWFSDIRLLKALS